MTDDFTPTEAGRKTVDIFTDGACSGNPGPGGWGAILRYGEVEKELYGGEPATTNNRMELMAAIMALEALKKPVTIRLFTDSEYVKNGITAWMRVNGGAIHGSRPWRVFGEGPTNPAGGMMGEGQAAAFTARDVRFTTRDGALFAFFLKWPEQPVAIAALGLRAMGGVPLARAELIGGGPVRFEQADDATTFYLPASGGGIVPVVRLAGAGLVQGVDRPT